MHTRCLWNKDEKLGKSYNGIKIEQYLKNYISSMCIKCDHIWRLKDILKDFSDFIYKKKIYEVMIFDLKKYINSESLFTTLYIDVR